VEDNLLHHAQRLPARESAKLIEHYHRLIALTYAEVVPYPAAALVRASRHLIRHAAALPVLLSAMASKPDWLFTHSTKQFTSAVAKRAALRIATPADFFRTLASLLR
jgi:hypothetical protein